MAMQWYIIHVLTNYENRVFFQIENHVKTDPKISKFIGDIKIPEEEVVEVKNGKKRKKKRKFFPGYVLIELDIPEDTEDWKGVSSNILKINGVAGFLGVQRYERPRPIPEEEAKSILVRMGEMKSDEVVSVFNYNAGDNVKVIDGPFNEFTGIVEDINQEKSKVRVKVEIFGRATPIDLDFSQIEKV